MRSDGDEDLRGRLPRLLDALGQGLLLAGVGLFIAALTGASVAGGAWYGATLSTLGLFTRAAAYVIEAHAIEHRGIVLPPLAPRWPLAGDGAGACPVVRARAGRGAGTFRGAARRRAARDRHGKGRLTLIRRRCSHLVAPCKPSLAVAREDVWRLFLFRASTSSLAQAWTALRSVAGPEGCGKGIRLLPTDQGWRMRRPACRRRAGSLAERP
jgi:hypothetical protein